jgi:D-alanyl-D-alanine carboxypeptidase/D-alanyl-D-alanine-endopeptidase (penicillin-binding protein 4)
MLAGASPRGSGARPADLDDDLAPVLDRLVREGPLGHSHAGIEVYSLDADRVIYALHGDELLNPASNTKLFTSAAALSILGSDYRYLTELYLDQDRQGRSHPRLGAHLGDRERAVPQGFT